MAPALFVLFALIIIVPIVEISAIVYVGQQIGPLPTVLLLIGSALIGSWLLRREGKKAWRAFRDTLEAGRTPGMEAVEGVLVLLGGLLMMLPGFATDIVGLLLVVPPVRRVAARIALGRIVRKLPPTIASDIMGGPVRVRSRRGQSTPAPPTAAPPAQGRVIEGEIEPPPPPPSA